MSAEVRFNFRVKSKKISIYQSTSIPTTTKKWVSSRLTLMHLTPGGTTRKLRGPQSAAGWTLVPAIQWCHMLLPVNRIPIFSASKSPVSEETLLRRAGCVHAPAQRFLPPRLSLRGGSRTRCGSRSLFFTLRWGLWDALRGHPERDLVPWAAQELLQLWQRSRCPPKVAQVLIAQSP